MVLARTAMFPDTVCEKITARYQMCGNVYIIDWRILQVPAFGGMTGAIGITRYVILSGYSLIQ